MITAREAYYNGLRTCSPATYVTGCRIATINAWVLCTLRYASVMLIACQKIGADAVVILHSTYPSSFGLPQTSILVGC